MKYIAFSLCAFAVLFSTSCVTSNVSQSGFLDNYSQLGPDLTRFDSAAVYLHPTVDFNQYDSVIIDPVIVIPGISSVTDQEKEQIAARLQDAFRRELKKDYKIVSQPGPRTMRLRTAITGDLTAVTGTPARFSYPNAKVINGLPNPSPVAKRVGTALVEVELVDSNNGKRLVALSDKELGDLRPDDTISTWDDISRLMSTGGVRTRQRLQDLRGRIL